MTELHVLSAGAAKGVVEALAPALQDGDRRDGCAATSAPSARSADKLSGRRALRRAHPHRLRCSRRWRARATSSRDTIAPLGRVRTGIAVRAGESRGRRSAIATRCAGACSRRRDCTCPTRSARRRACTSSRCCASWASATMPWPRLRAFPERRRSRCANSRNRADRAALAARRSRRSTTRRASSLVGPLPAEFELATVYSAAVAATARQPVIARRFVQMLTGTRRAICAAAGGFEV